MHDFAYTGLGVGGEAPGAQQESLLAVPGAADVAVEVCTLSKMYAMAGWRAGFLAGNSGIVAQAWLWHHQMGSMVAGMVQDAGAAALAGDQRCVAELAARYAARRRIVAEGLTRAGLDVFDSPGGIYVWAKAPERMNGKGLADLLLDRAGVAVLPGSCFGNVGARWVRISLLKDGAELERAVRRIAAALEDTWRREPDRQGLC